MSKALTRSWEKYSFAKFIEDMTKEPPKFTDYAQSLKQGTPKRANKTKISKKTKTT